MEFITNLNARESNDRLSQMVRHIEAETETTIRAIRQQGLDDSSVVHMATITKGYQKVDLWYEAKVRSLLKANAKAARVASNKARWQLLVAKNEHVRSTIAAAHERLVVMQTSGSAFYGSLLKALTLQGMCRLLEPHVQLVLRQGDVQLIEQLLPEVQSEYGKLTGGMQVRIIVDHKEHLPDSRVGGVLISARHRTVFVDNTLAIRFRRWTDVRLPFLRARLFCDSCSDGDNDGVGGGGGGGGGSGDSCGSDGKGDSDGCNGVYYGDGDGNGN